MLQSFLLQLIPAMEHGVILTVPLGILLAILLAQPVPVYKNIFQRALKWGFFGALFMVVVKTGTRQAVSREVFEGSTIFLSVLAELAVLSALFRTREPLQEGNRLLRYGVGTMTLMLFLYHGMEIFLMPVSIAVAATGNLFTMEVLVKSLGFAVGIFIGFVSGFFVYKASAALNYHRLLFVFAVQMAATVFQELIFFIQVLLARGVLSADWLLSLMAPLIDHQDSLIFVIYFVTFLVPVTLYLQPRPEQPAGTNPAQYRKILSSALHKKRWGACVFVVVITMVLFSSVGSHFANKKEELVPAVPVMAENGRVVIKLEEVSDGHLHRFAYRASDNTQVRFIVIKKGGQAYGIGLDACDICGPTGYFERDDQVVCKLCDVVMNKQTIGMQGGCNPVPLEYAIDGGAITIKQESLEKERKRFR